MCVCLSNNLKKGKYQQCKKDIRAEVDCPSAQYEERLLYNLNALCKVGCFHKLHRPVEAQEVTVSREDSEGCGVIHCSDEGSNAA